MSGIKIVAQFFIFSDRFGRYQTWEVPDSEVPIMRYQISVCDKYEYSLSKGV